MGFLPRTVSGRGCIWDDVGAGQAGFNELYCFVIMCRYNFCELLNRRQEEMRRKESSATYLTLLRRNALQPASPPRLNRGVDVDAFSVPPSWIQGRFLTTRLYRVDRLQMPPGMQMYYDNINGDIHYCTDDCPMALGTTLTSVNPEVMLQAVAGRKCHVVLHLHRQGPATLSTTTTLQIEPAALAIKPPGVPPCNEYGFIRELR